MYQVEVFANYVLRDLLPKEIIESFPKQVESSKQNTIIVYFQTTLERDQFLSVCRKYQFQTRMAM